MVEPVGEVAWQWTASSTLETDRLAEAVAIALPVRATIALLGTLGAGKTRFVQGLAAALGVSREEVVSPTFVLCQQYQGQRLIHHYDLYRLTRESDFWNLGPEEAFESDGLVLIEWADRFPNCLPSPRLEISIRVVSDSVRVFSIHARGSELEPVVERLRAWGAGREAAPGADPDS